MSLFDKLAGVVALSSAERRTPSASFIEWGGENARRGRETSIESGLIYDSASFSWAQGLHPRVNRSVLLCYTCHGTSLFSIGINVLAPTPARGLLQDPNVHPI